MNPVLIVCFVARLWLVIGIIELVKDGTRENAEKKDQIMNPFDWLRIFGYFGALTSAAFLILEITQMRKYGILGQKIWWNRYPHFLMYAIFAYLAFTYNKNAWIPLLLDVILGIIQNIIYTLKS